MARNITITFEDGSTHTYQNAPDKLTPEDVQARAESDFGKSVVAIDGGKGQSPGINDRGGLLHNLAGGFLRGAGSIGATILSPIDAAARAMNDGKPVSINGYEVLGMDRRAKMDNALKMVGADTDSLAFKSGKLGAEVAGTAGAGGAVAKGLTAVPAVASKAPMLAEALKTGGLSLGGTTGNVVKDMAIRTAGGAANGAVTAGMVNPDDAGTGALIGGAVPGGVKLAAALGRGAKSGAGAVVKNTLGLSTGAGGEAISTAYQAGKKGSQAFLDNMRGNVPVDDVLDKAKAALSQMRLDRSAAYKSGMAGVSADKTVIDFAPIDKAVTSLQSMGNYKGQVINKNSSAVVDEISDLVNKWKGLDPAEYHTPEGLDALKQAISDIRDTTQFGTAARKAADSAYNAVKAEIVSQAPTYSKVMKDYSLASETLSEVERALSLGNKAAADTGMRKLQSLMRNNVNTNYGNRVELAKILEQQGGQSILDDVAGQALNSWTPRGLQAATSGGAILSAPATSGLSLAALPATSPRLMGETAYAIGSVGRKTSQGATAVNQKLADLLRKANLPSLSSIPKPERETLLQLLAATPAVAATQQ